MLHYSHIWRKNMVAAGQSTNMLKQTKTKASTEQFNNDVQSISGKTFSVFLLVLVVVLLAILIQFSSV